MRPLFITTVCAHFHIPVAVRQGEVRIYSEKNECGGEVMKVALRRRPIFRIVFSLSLVMGLISFGLEELLLKKSIMIFLVLLVFAFSNTARQIYEQVREELQR